MKKITQQTERKLMGVIEKTSSLVTEGLSPNDAIIKAAEEGGLRPGEVNLVVHAYNTGRTTRQRQEGDDPFTKSAEFELADASVILEALYPTTVKTAGTIVEDTTISPDYSYSPKPMLERKTRWEKRAQNVDWRTIEGEQITAPEAYPTDPAHRAKLAMAKIDRMRRDTEEARRKAASAFDHIGKHFMDLTEYFRRPDAKPLPVVKEAVILLHGGKGEQIMDELVKVTPQLTKLANHREGSSLLGQRGRSQFGIGVDDLDCTAEPFDKIASVVRSIDEYKGLKAAYEAAEAEFNKEAGDTIAPFASPAASPSILGLSSDERVKSAFGMPDPLKALGTYSIVKNTMGGAADKLKGPESDKQVASVVDSLNDPSHEAKLREINTQAMLQDLMLNDQVISGYDPDEVTDAYNDIVQVSPSVGDQRMIIQGLLRKQLQQGQLDTFEQDQLLGFEDKLRKQNTPMKAGGGDGSVI